MVATLTAVSLASCAQGDTPPDTPQGLVASPGNRSVALSWTEISDATSYTLYYATSPNVTQRSYKVANVKKPHGHFPLENGKRYYYRLAAANGNGESPLSVEVSATPTRTATAAGAPASVIATAMSGKVTISWGPVAFASGYTLYRDTITGVYPGNGTEIENVTSPYEDTGLTNGTTYYYVVAAKVDGKMGLPSAEVSATPGGSTTTARPPASVSATAGDKKVTLSWSSVSGASGYTVYWSTTSGVTPATGTAIFGATSPYTHANLTNATTYYYVVTSTVAGKQSAASTQVSATPTGGSTTTKPSAPTGLTASAGSGLVTLNWNTVSGATSYNVYWSTSSSVSPSTGTKISGAMPPYTHTGRTNGTTYYYVVTASNSAGESPASSAASATPQGGTMAYGQFSSTLSSGAYAIALFENTHNSKGIIQLMVYTSDPTVSGAPKSGLSVRVSGGATGSLPATQAGVYANTTPGPIKAGTYTFSVSGSVSGTVTATLNKLATCTMTRPISGTAQLAGKDLTLKWTSTNSQKANVLLKDTRGTVQYNPLKPDPGGVIVPGKDIPNKGALEIVVSWVWSLKQATGGIVMMGDGYSKISLY